MSPEEVKDLRRWLEESGGIAEGKPFLGTRTLDAMVDVMQELAAQIWVLKRRNMVLEQLLTQNGTLAQNAVEGFNFNKEDVAEQRQIRAEFVSTIFRSMKELPEEA